jgi:hypothetical protein
VLLRALALETQERFATADAFRAGLNACLEGREIATDSAPRTLAARDEIAIVAQTAPARATSDRETGRPRMRRSPQRGASRGRLGERNSGSQRARLAVTPLRVDLGEASAGEELACALTISNAGPPGATSLQGEIEPVAPRAQGAGAEIATAMVMRLEIAPTVFGPLAPGESLCVHISLWPIAGERTALVAVRAHGGEQQIVPVRFQVRSR